ncbi:MAG: amino acid permease [Spirochaetales bacterium]|nr:amino acid permease [Spirochaetales bacterium]
MASKPSDAGGRPAMTKQLGHVHVFSLASGAMISSGLFVLPAVIYGIAGPAIILGYIIAGILMIPAMLAKAELATAMPRSGGDYFFIHRSFGPLFGTFSGFADWFSLSLKSAFALVGIGIFLGPLFQGFSDTTIKAVAIGFTLLFTLLNILSVKGSGKFQVILVFGLLSILIVYIFLGMGHIDVLRYTPFLPNGWISLVTVTGMIFISFGGLTKIVSVAGEIKNPRHTIPEGMFTAFFVVILFYVLSVFVTVGLLDAESFGQTLIPLSRGAGVFAGNIGFIALTTAAMLAFITTGNAGILAASRNPFAMANDALLPSMLAKVSLRFKTPVVSLILTAALMTGVIAFLDIESLVKVASTMMLINFSFVNVAVILMRESKIVSYKPTFKTPLYPYINIAGIVLYFFLIAVIGVEMIVERGPLGGMVTFGITAGFFLLSLLWYLLYSKSRSKRDSALICVVERVTSKEIRTTRLTEELREILIERDRIIEDRFDRIIKNAVFADITEETDKDDLFSMLSEIFYEKFGISARKINTLFRKREKDSTTAVLPGLAIPHIIIDGEHKFDMVVVRSKPGIRFGSSIPLVNVVFALAGTRDERNFHLQALMAIAQIMQNKDFEHHWMKTRSTEDLRNLILVAQRVRKGEV